MNAWSVIDRPPLPPPMPRFRVPRRIVIGMGPDILLGRRRSFARDCAGMVRAMRPRPSLRGRAHIPRTGPFLLAVNHCEGPGLWIGWPAALLTYAVASVRGGDPPVHWLVTADMNRERVGGLKRLIPSTHWFFGRVAAAWGMVTIPRADARTGARAVAIRQLLRLLAPPAGTGEPAGFFPEGEGDGLTRLRPAAPGTGALVALAGRRGVPVLPAAAWLDGGRLHGAFGPLWYPTGCDDAALRQELMARIAALLPARFSE